jgi:hypothetical protein
MRGGALPPALLFAALAFALAFAAPQIRIWSLAALAVTITIIAQVTFAPRWVEIAYLGCWASIVGTAAAVHLPRGMGMRLGLAAAVNAGFWACAVVALSGVPTDLKAISTLAVMLPAGWLIARGGSIAVKVGSSWLMAIAILAAALPFLPVTPGYAPDHLE